MSSADDKKTDEKVNAKASGAESIDAKTSGTDGGGAKANLSEGNDTKAGDSADSGTKGSKSDGSDAKTGGSADSGTKGSKSDGSDAKTGGSAGSGTKGSKSDGSDAKTRDSADSDAKTGGSAGSDTKASESEDSKGKVSDTESGEGEDSESPERGDINGETREEAPLKSYDVRNVLLILVAVAAVIVMAVSAFALFQNPLVRVLSASRKTIMDNDIMKALDPMEIISDGSFSSNFSFSASSTGVSFGADYSQDGKKKQQSFAATANVGLARVELQEYFDREQVLLFMPGVTGNSYSYDYRNGKLGDLAGRLGLTEEKEEALADILSVVADGKWQRSRSFISPGGTVGKWFTGLDYEKADPAECEINGKKRNCKGYSVRVESEDMERLLDLLAKERKSDRRRIRDDLETLGFSESAVCSAGRKIADTVTGGQFTFYIWRGQLAQFVCELNNTNAVISFKGGSYPAQNVDADVNGRSVAIKGVTDGNVEEISVLLDGDNAGTVKYDRSAGDMDIVTADRGMYLRIENDGKKWKLSTDDPLLIGGAPLTGSLTFEKDPKIIKPGTEKVVDITELNNEALSRIGESLFELLK